MLLSFNLYYILIKFSFTHFYEIFENLGQGLLNYCHFFGQRPKFLNFFFSILAQRGKKWLKKGLFVIKITFLITCNTYLLLFILRAFTLHYICKNRFFIRKNDVIKCDVICEGVWDLIMDLGLFFAFLGLMCTLVKFYCQYCF